jgi:hypothetical protein
MKYIYIFCFLLISTNAFPQKPGFNSARETLMKSVDNIAYLDSLAELNNDIYLNSFTWVYNGFHTVEKEYFYDLLARTSAMPPVTHSINGKTENFAKRIEILRDRLINLAALVKINMSYVENFDAFENPEIREASEAYFDRVVAPEYWEIKLLIQSEIKKEEQYIAELSRGFAKNKNTLISGTEIINQYEVLSRRQVCSRMAFDLYIGAGNWVYRPADTLSKKFFSDILYSYYGSLIKTIENDAESGSEETFESTRECLAAMDKLYKEVIEIIEESLVNDEDYHNPMKMMIAEEAFIFNAGHLFSTALILLEKNKKSEREAFEAIFSDDQALKLADIKKMLRYSMPPIQSLNKEDAASQALAKEELLHRVALIYAKKFTHSEIKEILAFQKSKTGKKIQRQKNSILLELAKQVQ